MRIRFADLELDTQRFILHRGRNRIRLRPKVFDLLIYLVAQHARVVPREELVEMLWGATLVGEGSLSGLVNELRKRLGERGDATSSIRTVHARGYQFVAEVLSEEVGDEDRMSPHISDRSASITDRMGRQELLRLFESEGLVSPPMRLVERLLVHLGNAEGANSGLSRPGSVESGSEVRLDSARRMRSVRHRSTDQGSRHGTG